jgi:hypothetical protein
MVTLTDDRGNKHPVNRADLEDVVRRYLATQRIQQNNYDATGLTTEELDALGSYESDETVSAAIDSIVKTGDVRAVLS